MEFKDLTGLSKPLVRLIEVVSDGVGQIFRPCFMRRKADADAYAIDVISNAIDHAATEHGVQVAYSNNGIEAWQLPDDHTIALNETPMQQRIDSRENYQQRKQQKNIENITAIAAEELVDKDEISDEKPDEDWITRFFDSAKNISSEQMQDLWGRILAGEIVKPGSYSLRSMESLRNISKDEAELFNLIGKLAFRWSNGAFVIYNKDWLKNTYQILPIHHHILAEINLLYPSDLTVVFFSEPETDQEILIHGNHLLIAEKNSNVKSLRMPVLKFTTVGFELLNLISSINDSKHLCQIKAFLDSQKIKSTIGYITETLPNGKVRYDSLNCQ